MVNPAETESTTYNTRGNESVCRHAAQNQMIPALTLLAAALLLLLALRRPIGWTK